MSKYIYILKKIIFQQHANKAQYMVIRQTINLYTQSILDFNSSCSHVQPDKCISTQKQNQNSFYKLYVIVLLTS